MSEQYAVDIHDRTTVLHLIDSQFPELSDLEPRLLESSATDNVVYRLGNEFVVRLPRSPAAAGQIDKDIYWLPVIQRELSARIPSIVGIGEPDESFPYRWTIQRWIDGHDAMSTAPADLPAVARSLAGVVGELRGMDASSGPTPDASNSLRGAPLDQLDERVRRAAAFTMEMGSNSRFTAGIDGARVLDIWQRAVDAPAWTSAPVWVHGDLTPGNVLLSGNHLAAIIDFGCAGVGDPACDHIPAWTLFKGGARDEFLRLTHVDDDTLVRAQGWAAYVGITAMPYHHQSNPAFCQFARGVLDELLDFAS